MKHTYPIRGMHCASCALYIEKELNKLPEVKSAVVNYASEKVTLEADGQPDLAKLKEAVAKAGNYQLMAADQHQGMDHGKMDHASHGPEVDKQRKLMVWSIILTAIIFLINWFLEFAGKNLLMLVLTTPVQFIIGKQFYQATWPAVKRFRANMDTLIAMGTSVAYFFSLAVIILGADQLVYFEISAAIITLVIVGRYLEAKAKSQASSAIKKLLELAAKKATVIREGKEVEIEISEVKVGDLILVRPGESIPVEKSAGDLVIGATVNQKGVLKFKAAKVGNETMLARIVKMVEEAQGSKAPIQKLADSISAVFVPIVILIAVLTFLGWYFLTPLGLTPAIINAVAVLVIACPCALGLAT